MQRHPVLLTPRSEPTCNSGPRTIRSPFRAGRSGGLAAPDPRLPWPRFLSRRRPEEKGTPLSRRTRIITASCVAALALGACNKNKTPPPPPELSVTLVDPGEAPLERMQYAIPEGTALASLLTVRDLEIERDASAEADEAFGVLPG